MSLQKTFDINYYYYYYYYLIIIIIIVTVDIVHHSHKKVSHNLEKKAN